MAGNSVLYVLSICVFCLFNAVFADRKGEVTSGRNQNTMFQYKWISRSFLQTYEQTQANSIYFVEVTYDNFDTFCEHDYTKKIRLRVKEIEVSSVIDVDCQYKLWICISNSSTASREFQMHLPNKDWIVVEDNIPALGKKSEYRNFEAVECDNTWLYIIIGCMSAVIVVCIALLFKQLKNKEKPETITNTCQATSERVYYTIDENNPYSYAKPEY